MQDSQTYAAASFLPTALLVLVAILFVLPIPNFRLLLIHLNLRLYAQSEDHTDTFVRRLDITELLCERISYEVL